MVFILGGVHAEIAIGQEPRLLSSRPCHDCRVELEPTTRLGEADGVGAIGSVAAIDRLRDGRFVLVHHPVDYEIVVFSSDGEPLERLGRQGDGPGEYRFIRWIRAGDSSVHVFDARHHRRTVLSDRLQVTQTHSYRGQLLGDVAIVADSIVVLNGLVRSRERIGYALHILSRSGGIAASFDEYPGGYTFNTSSERYMRALSPSGDGTVWSAHRTVYRLDRWNLSSHTAQTFERKVDWFPQHAGEDGGPVQPDEPRKPRIMAIHEDAGGLVWVLIRVAARNWEDALARTDSPQHREHGAFRISDVNRAYDTVVEVIDPRAAAVIASARFDPALITFAGPQSVVSAHTDDHLIPFVQVWTLNLTTQSQGREE